jgi:hypothetical protein
MDSPSHPGTHTVSHAACIYATFMPPRHNGGADKIVGITVPAMSSITPTASFAPAKPQAAAAAPKPPANAAIQANTSKAATTHHHRTGHKVDLTV